MNQLLNGRDGLVARHLNDVGRQLTNAAKVLCPVDTGNLRRSHEYSVEQVDGDIVAHVGATAEYAEAVHNGVDVTVPTRSGGTVHIHRKPNPWLERAARQLGLDIQMS